MGSRIDVEADRIVHATVTGSIDHDERVQIRSDVAEVCRKNDILHVVIDHRSSDIEMSTIEHYSFGESFDAAGFPDDTWIGVILHDQVMASTMALFSIAVAQSRGVQVSVFADERTANFAANARLDAPSC